MKRFYRIAEAAEAPGGWTVALDGKSVRTPAKAPLLIPGRALAAAAAEEWAAQEAEVRPAEMPLTRAAMTAIDRTALAYDAVAEAVAKYGGTDLLCYRAEAPAELRARQDEAWDPLLDWAEAEHGARLSVTAGLMHAPQPAEALARLDAATRRFDAFGLTALSDLVALSGSLVIGLAVASGRLEPGEGWRASRVDETWQEEFWGEDDEATAAAARKARDFAAAARLLALLREG